MTASALATARRTASTRNAVLALIAAGLVGLSILTLLGGFGHPLGIDRLIAVAAGSGTGSEAYIVGQLRLPRLLMGALVGACLGVSGALFQGLSRNPLGSPDIIGINAGAATGALLVILVFHAGETLTPVGALTGGLLTGLVVFAIGSRHRMNPTRLILAGIAIGPLLTAINTYLLLRADVDNAENAARWLVGSLNGAEWGRVTYLAVVLAALIPFVLLLARPLDLMGMGDDVATSLGVAVPRVRIGVAVVAVVLAAVATAASGPIAFVALTAPHLARWVRPGGVRPATSALMGAGVMITADFVATYASTALSLQVGTVTGLLGGAYLALYLGLMARRTRRATTL